MELKSNSTKNKISGTYYTPEFLVEIIVRKLLHGQNFKRVLEPSCGDGRFIKTALSMPNFASAKFIGIDNDSGEIALIRQELSLFKNVRLLANDFFRFYEEKANEFDLVFGNPPYIRYQYLSSEQRSDLSKVLTQNGLRPNKLINTWAAFTIACSSLLSREGVLAFVLPAEILQVAYAREVRDFLSRTFSEITIFSFQKPIFPDIQQEIVIFVGRKGGEKKGVSIVQSLDLQDLDQKDLGRIKYFMADSENEKWTGFFAESDLFNDILRIKKDKRFIPLHDLAIINVGVTTGDNDFFSIDDKTRARYQLDSYLVPMIGKSNQVKGISFTEKDLRINIAAGNKSNLLVLPDSDEGNLPNKCRDYLDLGVRLGVPKGYKCSIRSHWFSIPSIWIPDAFFLRRNNVFPKFVLNKEKAISTDTMHRIKFKKGVNKRLVILSYYNSVSFAFTEICGRSYGGGVLEILPSEAGEIYIPNPDLLAKVDASKGFEKVDEMIRRKEPIDEILDYTDRIILIDCLGFTKSECSLFREFWRKMGCRRLKRKNYSDDFSEKTPN